MYYQDQHDLTSVGTRDEYTISSVLGHTLLDARGYILDEAHVAFICDRETEVPNGHLDTGSMVDEVVVNINYNHSAGLAITANDAEGQVVKPETMAEAAAIINAIFERTHDLSWGYTTLQQIADEAILDQLAKRRRFDRDLSKPWDDCEDWYVVEIDRDGDQWKATYDKSDGWITFKTTDPAVVKGVIDDLLTDADHDMTLREWLLDGNTQLNTSWLESTHFSYEPPEGVDGAFSLVYDDPELIDLGEWLKSAK